MEREDKIVLYTTDGSLVTDIQQDKDYISHLDLAMTKCLKGEGGKVE